MLDQWLARYVRKEAKLRSAYEIERVVRRDIEPAIGKIGVYQIRRSHVVAMLDDIADASGARTADLALAYLRGPALGMRRAMTISFRLSSGV
jgi:hypothetical protein